MYRLLTVAAVAAIFVSGCNEDTTTGVETDSNRSNVTTTPVVGPNLSGGGWAGHFKSIEGFFEPLTAEIEHVGSRVTIRTSKTTGVAGTLVGKINGIGQLLLYDTFDNEDWTTLYGPVSTNSINLADFVYSDDEKVDTNIIILKRTAPAPKPDVEPRQPGSEPDTDGEPSDDAGETVVAETNFQPGRS